MPRVCQVYGSDEIDLMDSLHKESESGPVWGEEEGVVPSEVIQGLMKCFDEAGLL